MNKNNDFTNPNNQQNDNLSSDKELEFLNEEELKIVNSLLNRFDSLMDRNLANDSKDLLKGKEDSPVNTSEDNAEDALKANLEQQLEQQLDDLEEFESINLESEDMEYVNTRPEVSFNWSGYKDVRKDFKKLQDRYNKLFKEESLSSSFKKEKKASKDDLEDIEILLGNKKEKKEGLTLQNLNEVSEEASKKDDLLGNEDHEVFAQHFLDTELNFDNLEKTFESVHQDNLNLQKDQAKDLELAGNIEKKEEFIEKDPLKQAFDEGFNALDLNFLPHQSQKISTMQKEDFENKRTEESYIPQNSNETKHEGAIREPLHHETDVNKKEKTQIQNMDDQLELINQKICSLSDSLQERVCKILLEESIPKKELKDLVDALLIEDEKKVKEIVSRNLEETTKLVKEQKVRRFISFVFLYRTMLFCMVILLFLLWFLYQNDQNKKDETYRTLISDLHKGSSYYDSVDKRFTKAQKTYQDQEWEFKYVLEYLKIGSPLALYHAHKILMGDDSLNEKWKAKYHPLFLKTWPMKNANDNFNFYDENKKINEDVNLKNFLNFNNFNKKNPNYNVKKFESFKDQYSNFDIFNILNGLSSFFENFGKSVKENLVDVKGFLFDIISSKSDSTEFLNVRYADEDEFQYHLIHLYKSKALWAYNYREWDDLNFFMENITEYFYQKLVNKYSDDYEVYGLLADAYIHWANYLLEFNKEAVNAKYQQAYSIYKDILQKDSNNLVALFGLLNLAFLSKDKKEAKKIIHYLEEVQHNEYPYSISTEAQVDTLLKYLDICMNDPNFLNLTLRESSQKINQLFDYFNILMERGYIYPKVYYYLGYNAYLKNHYYDSIEYYIKGLIAFYLSDESFFKYSKSKLNQLEDYNQFLMMSMEKLINYIRNDFNFSHIQIQSKIFHGLAKSFVKIAKTLSADIEIEESERKLFFEIAKKNLILSLEKNPQNYESWYYLGNIYYEDILSRNAFQYSYTNSKDLGGFLYEKPESRYAKIKEYYLNSIFSLSKDIGFFNLSFSEKENTLKTVLMDLNIDKLNTETVDFLYRLGFIYYQEANYNYAYLLWTTIKQKDIRYINNPILNFSLGNIHINLNNYVYAKTFYKTILDYYAPILSKNKDFFNPKNYKEVAFFIHLAKVYNNLGVAYHLESEKKSNYFMRDNLRREALFFYYRAKEYLGYISLRNQDLVLKSNEMNIRKVFNNIVLMETSDTELKKKRPPYDQVLKNMIIDDLDPILDSYTYNAFID